MTLPQVRDARALYTPRLVLILALQFVFGLGYSSFFLLPRYLTEVHRADATIIGRIMAAGPVAAVLAMLVLARRIDRLRRHYLLFGSALAMLVASLGFSLVTELGLGVYGLRILQGAAFTVYMSTGAALVAELSPPERLGQAIGLLGASNLATNAIGPALAEPLSLAEGWRSVFLLSAACSCLAAIGTVLLREPAREQPTEYVSPRLGDPRRLGLLYASMVAGLGFGTVVTFYQPLALEIGILQVRDLFVGYTLAALGVRVVFGAWLDRFDRRRLALFACSAYALVVIATAGLERGWLFPLGLVLGLAQGTLYPVCSALLIEGSEPEVRGALVTYFGGAFNVGMVLSTLGFGVIAAAIGYRPVFMLAGVLAASAVPVIARAVAKPSSDASQRRRTVT